jgi:hypothetical protein
MLRGLSCAHRRLGREDLRRRVIYRLEVWLLWVMMELMPAFQYAAVGHAHVAMVGVDYLFQLHVAILL